jgi:hypothetical protein
VTTPSNKQYITLFTYNHKRQLTAKSKKKKKAALPKQLQHRNTVCRG